MKTESLDQVFVNAASGLTAQSVRMNTIASNLANAGSIGSSEDTTYRKKFPIFSEVTQKLSGLSDDTQPIGGVTVKKISHSTKSLEKLYQPNSPQADKDGFVYLTDVNTIEEMTNMIAASKAYEANVEVMNTTKNLVTQSLNLINTKE